jgi:exosortase family protein XrtF
MVWLKEKIINYYQYTPKPVKYFLAKALAIAVVWKLIYLLFLMNSRILDGPLTNHVGVSSVSVLNRLSGLDDFSAHINVDTTIMEGQFQISIVSKIMHHNHKVLHIADGCNGLELMVLYSGFIFCFPSNGSKKLWYILFGVIIIDSMNIFRCAALGFVKEYYHPYFNISHHFFFKAIIYSVIVILWIQFTKKTTMNAATL